MTVVMCCGCRSILGKAGELIKHPGGLVTARTVPEFFLDFKDGGRCAEFQTAGEGNTAALKAGWQIKDSTGENHRCPECLELVRRKEYEAYAGRGAMLEIRDGRIIA